MSDPLEAARAALRERQGSGARHDAANAPHRELDWARRGTAYFARMLNGLSDADLDGPSAVPGSLRRVVVAHAGYHARALSEVVSRARQGVCDRVAGSLLVDDGARKALREQGKSLLPPGILRCDGDFEAGEIVRVCDTDGTEFARGQVEFGADTIRASQLKRVEIIHRDNLVVL